jgi:hypothetical protein
MARSCCRSRRALTRAQAVVEREVSCTGLREPVCVARHERRVDAWRSSPSDAAGDSGRLDQRTLKLIPSIYRSLRAN